MKREIVIGFIKMVWKLYAKAEAQKYVEETDNEFDDEAFKVLDVVINNLK